ncbi:MAG: hypothetical protein ACQCXQ_06940 [Verrucomicrobiales bacterium]|nr:hypothetical protein [Verrucomicrobiota bacterium JB025]
MKILTHAPVLALLSIACLTGHAKAQQLSQTLYFGPSIPQFTSTLTFDSFTGNLDDLTSVEIYWETEIYGGQLVIDNDSTSTATGSYEFGSVIVLNNSGTEVRTIDESFQSIFSDTQVINEGTFALAPNEGDSSYDYSADGPDGISITGESKTNSGGGTVSSFVYEDYVSGIGGTADSTFDLVFDTQQYLNVSSNGGTEYAITPVYSLGSVTLVYNYVPEPVAPTMACLSLALLALRRRRF